MPLLALPAGGTACSPVQHRSQMQQPFGFYSQYPVHPSSIYACKTEAVSWWVQTLCDRYEWELVGQRPKCSTEISQGKAGTNFGSIAQSVEDMCRVP